MSRLNEDLESVAFRDGVEQAFWRLESRSGDVLYLTMIAPDGLEFLLEAVCDGYGQEPILGRFVDPKTRACRPDVWPQGDAPFENWIKFQPGHLFICWPQDRRGIGQHPEWRNTEAWKKNNNQLVAYLSFIRDMLHIPARGYRRKTTATAA